MSEFKARVSAAHLFLARTLPRDGWVSFGQRAKDTIADLGGGRAMDLTGEAAARFLAFIEGEAERHGFASANTKASAS